MSYILDALRRADAERERGSVPGIHAQTVPVASADAPARGTIRPWVWGVFGVSLGLLVALLGWGLLGEDEPAAADPVVAQPPPPVPAAPPAPPPVANLPDAPIEQRPTAAEALAAARRPTPPAAAAPTGATAAAAATGATAASAVPAGQGRVLGRHELPDDIRRQLPALVISGSIYSPKPANRFVIINGQVVHENGSVGPDHVLEQIKLKAAVLRFKGHRYEITF